MSLPRFPSEDEQRVNGQKLDILVKTMRARGMEFVDTVLLTPGAAAITLGLTPVQWQNLGSAVRYVRKMLQGTHFSRHPHEARIRLILTEGLEADRQESPEAKNAAVAALYYLTAVEPNIDKKQRETFEMLMKP